MEPADKVYSRLLENWDSVMSDTTVLLRRLKEYRSDPRGVKILMEFFTAIDGETATPQSALYNTDDLIKRLEALKRIDL